MAEKTRHVFFSLGGSSVLGGVAANESKHFKASPHAGAVTKESGQPRRKPGTAVLHGDTNKQQFSINFGRKEAWQWQGQPTIRTQGE